MTNTVDVMDWNHKMHLTIADYFLMYPLLFQQLPSTFAPAVTAHFTELFSLECIPKEMFTYNGWPFTLGRAKFAEKYGFKHVMSSQHYPHRMNVKTLKTP